MTWEWRRKRPLPDPVNVNERMAALPTDDLFNLVEQSLLTAQESWSRAHMNPEDIEFFYDRVGASIEQAGLALAALRAKSS